MHIPKGPTAGLELALFEPALQAALQPSPDYDAAQYLLRVPLHFGHPR